MGNGWVAFGYLVTYGALALYGLSLWWRLGRARADAGD